MVTARTVSLRPGRVDELRIAKGMSLEKLSQKSVVCTKTVSSMNEGNNVLVSSVEKIARALNISPSELLERKIESETQKPNSVSNNLTVIFRVDVPFNETDETKFIPTVIEILSKTFPAFSQFLQIESVEKRSVAIAIVGPEEFALAAVNALGDSLLEPLQVKSVILTLPCSPTLLSKTLTLATVEPVDSPLLHLAPFALFANYLAPGFSLIRTLAIAAALKSLIKLANNLGIAKEIEFRRKPSAGTGQLRLGLENPRP